MRRGLNKVAPPTLPEPGKDYAQGYFERMNGVLRLYFFRIANTLNVLLGRAGGRFLENPHGVFYSMATQTLAAADTPTAITFEGESFAYAVTVQGSQFTPEFSGIYLITFTGHSVSSKAAETVLFIWARIDGEDVPASALEYAVAGSGKGETVEHALQMRLLAGQQVELMWAADDTTVQLDALATNTFRPGAPSAIVEVFLSSAYPET